jgi:hypothetical protein
LRRRSSVLRNNASWRRSGSGLRNSDTWRSFEREREEKIRLDEELWRTRTGANGSPSRTRALLAEAQEREANRLREEDSERHVVEVERLRVLEEQRRKADEKNHQQQHQDEILRQRARVEQQRERQRREAQYYQRK